MNVVGDLVPRPTEETTPVEWGDPLGQPSTDRVPFVCIGITFTTGKGPGNLYSVRGRGCKEFKIL